MDQERKLSLEQNIREMSRDFRMVIDEETVAEIRESNCQAR